MTYPSEFKNKVLETKEKENLSIDQTAERFSIDRSTVIYWVNSNRPHKYPQQKTDDVISDVKKYPYDTLYERASRLNMGASTISAILRQLKEKHNQ